MTIHVHHVVQSELRCQEGELRFLQMTSERPMRGSEQRSSQMTLQKWTVESSQLVTNIKPREFSFNSVGDEVNGLGWEAKSCQLTGVHS